ncbi:helix-turn-helix domain-containing protein [Macrococcoides caseolyticum]|uniref:helix-turn-helix domain-containing protein n=1 Tax=Macrococcoides caseolyticum TaxID=69966 RepID=UPI001F47491B|nr:helix-turn-helix domain-containing protein [Macrococcus caseolyticus]MCE4957226.1 helix-turn-helix domain-containing protein [Macrococcus caseolyticus]
MKLIGQILRSKRESLGMTLIDLEKKVRIQKKYIEMIEKNEFDRLPNPDYTRGFIEKYAKAVNLNAESLLSEHKDELPAKKLSAKEASQQIKNTAVEHQSDNSVQKLLVWILGISVVLFLVWLIFSQFIFTDKNNVWQAEDINKSRDVKVERKTEEKPVATTATPKKETKENVKVKPKVEPVKLTYKNFDGANLAYEISTNQPIELKVNSSIPTWVQVYDSNKKNYVYKEIKNEVIKIDKNVKSITLISGNSTTMNVFINGVKVNVPKEAENLITRTYFFKVVQ